MSSCAKILDELERIYRFKEVEHLSPEITSHLEQCPNCEKESRCLAFYFERIELICEKVSIPERLFEDLKEALYKKIGKDFIRSSVDNSTNRVSRVEASPRIPANAGTSPDSLRNLVTASKSDTPLISGSKIEADETSPYVIPKSHFGTSNDFKEKIKIIAWILGIIALLSVSYFGFIFYQETAPWRVGLVEGGYTILGNPFSVNEIYETNILTTSVNSRALISVPGGGEIMLHPDSELKLLNTWKNFKKVKLTKGKIILSQFSARSDFTLIAGKLKISPLNSVTEVQRNILGKTIVECTNMYSETELDDNFIVPKNYLVEVSEDDVSCIPFSRGTASSIIECIKRINRGIFTDQDFRNVAQNSTEKDIFSLVQLLKIAKGESKVIIFNKLREYSMPPGEIIRVSPESLSDEDIKTWTNRLLLEKIN